MLGLFCSLLDDQDLSSGDFEEVLAVVERE